MCFRVFYVNGGDCRYKHKRPLHLSSLRIKHDPLTLIIIIIIFIMSPHYTQIMLSILCVYSQTFTMLKGKTVIWTCNLLVLESISSTITPFCSTPAGTMQFLPNFTKRMYKTVQNWSRKAPEIWGNTSLQLWARGWCQRSWQYNDLGDRFRTRGANPPKSSQRHFPTYFLISLSNIRIRTACRGSIINFLHKSSASWRDTGHAIGSGSTAQDSFTGLWQVWFCTVRFPPLHLQL